MLQKNATLHFKVEQQNNRIYLPKIGWLRYRNSRAISGLSSGLSIEIFCVRDELERVRNYANRRAVSARAATATASDGNTAAGSWILFADCTAKYAEMAETADAQRNELAEWRAYGETVSALNDN